MSRRSTGAFSLQGKFVFYSLVLIAFAVIVNAVAFYYFTFWGGVLVSLVLMVPITIVVAQRASRPVVRLINALSDSTDNIRDHDYSVTIASTRKDELGQLVRNHNEIGQLLRAERYGINQRELLLDTVLQSTPVAMLLCDDRDHVVYSNIEARQLLADGRRLQGEELQGLLDSLDADLAAAVRGEKEGLVAIHGGGDPQTYYLSCRFFSLNSRTHKLHMIRRMTREISRQEVMTWKRVIRVISHELNNSLAPISSLSHSGKLAMSKVAAISDVDLDKLEGWGKLQLILDSIGERASHLKEFVEGYARFSRLPAPRVQDFDLHVLLRQMAEHQKFDIVVSQPKLEVRLDQTQIEQVLINLVKNARDAAGENGRLQVSAECAGDHLLLVVADNGPGMSDKVMRQALLPFYSTKQEGTGLGLPLCREIVEAHGGQLSIRNGETAGVEVILRLPQGRALRLPTW